MKFRYLAGMLFVGSLTFYACKKSSSTDNNGGNNNTTPTVTALTCSSAVFSAQAFAGDAYTGTATVPYTGGNSLAYPTGTAVSSTGVTGLTATLVAGTLANGNGNATFNITGTPSGAGAASFAVTLGGQSCAINLTVQPALAYAGKWAYQYLRDSMYNWAAFNNNQLQYDSMRVLDYRTSIGYFQFNNNKTYKWQTSSTTATPYTGSFSILTNTGYGYGTTLQCLGISTQAPPNDTTNLYIYKLTPPNMTINRDFLLGINGNGDTFIVDRYYELLKQ